MEAEVPDCASRIRAEIEETAAWSDLRSLLRSAVRDCQ